MQKFPKLLLSTLGISLFVLILFSCGGDDPEPDPNAGKIIFNFKHLVDGIEAEYDTINYVNAAGNNYEISLIQYFITDVILHKDDGREDTLDGFKFYHYVDSDVAGSEQWQVFDDIPVGTYDSISFIFGFTEDRNQSFMFVNAPEKNMSWPEFLGGGYHYLKLNMKWIPVGSSSTGFNFHLGIGQDYDTLGNITAFHHNYFPVTLDDASFTMAKGQTREIDIHMNVEQWFVDPHTFNYGDWGGDIMQNQQAMRLGSENGHNVFTLGQIQ